LSAQLQSTLNAISQSSTQEVLWSTLFSYMNMCDIHSMVYHHLPTLGSADYGENIVVKKQFELGDVGQVEFVSYIFDSRLRIGARTMTDCKYWSYTVESAADIIQEDEASPKISLTQDITAITLPVHGPGGRNGCFSLVYSGVDRIEVGQRMRVLQWACQNAHQVFCKLHLLNSKTIPALTERELEILTWVSRGKSNSVIAQILGISHHTVNTYLRRIFLKLGTSDRTSVSVIGISNGLIEP